MVPPDPIHCSPGDLPQSALEPGGENSKQLSHVQIVFLALSDCELYFFAQAWCKIFTVIWPDQDPPPLILQPSVTEKAEQSGAAAADDVLFSNRRQLYATDIRQFLAIQLWDVIGRLRPSAYARTIFEAFLGRKAHNVNPFGMEFIQNFLNSVVQALPDFEIMLPCPCRYLFVITLFLEIGLTHLW